MKRTLLLFPVIALLSYVLLTSNIAGPGVASGLERSGASGTAGCGGSGCHSAAATASVMAYIEVRSGATPVTTYTPGASYTIHLQGMNSSTLDDLPRFGFQLSAVKAASTTVNAGVFSAVAGTHTVTASGIKLVEHGPTSLAPSSGTGGDGTTYEVDIPWTAPVAGTGTVKFFAALNVVTTLAGADAGDKWTVTTALLTEGAPAPVGPITGTLSVCAGSTTTLSNSSAGGTWSVLSSSIATIGTSTGIVTGVAPGTTTVYYNAGTAGTATAVVTVNAAPSAITGTPTICIAATTTLSSTPAGGTWSSGAPTVATVATGTGVVTGVSAGTADVSYTNAGGCRAVRTVTVNASGAAAIAGATTVCVGTTITLTNATAGGTWSNGGASTLSVGAATGIVTGLAVGTGIITYTATNACGSSAKYLTVNVLPSGSCPTAAVEGPQAQTASLKIFPNPNRGVFTIKLESPLPERVTVVIRNVIGVKVKEQVIASNSAENVILTEPAGIYFLAVYTANGVINQQVILE